MLLTAIISCLLALLPVLALATPPATEGDDTASGNPELVENVRALEAANLIQQRDLNELVHSVAQLEGEDALYGGLTYRAEYVSGGPRHGFSHGAQLGIGYRSWLDDNLLLTVELVADTDADLFRRHVLSDGGNTARLDKAYFEAHFK